MTHAYVCWAPGARVTFLFKAGPLMNASGLEKSDLGKNRFYWALIMPNPNSKIMEAERVRAVYWLEQLANHVAVAIRCHRLYAIARGDMPARL